MRTELIGAPAYATLAVDLSPGESITAEAGAMMSMEGDVELKTKSGGLFKALTTKEPLFRNTFEAKSDARILLSPSVPGDIVHIKLTQPVTINSACYLAHTGDVEFKTVWKGLKGMIGGGGMFWLQARGTGDLWLNAYGQIIEKDIRPGDKFMADNTHLVAMEESVTWKTRKLGGMKTFMFGGEGFVFEVGGQGKLHLQTRNPSIFFVKTK